MYNAGQATPAYRQSAGEGLMWSEYLYLIAVVVAAFYVVDPFTWGIYRIPEVKHLPLLLTLPAFVLTMGGRRLGELQSEPVLSRVIASAWPLALLALFIIAGSAFARLAEGIGETLLNSGLYMLMLFVAAAMVLLSKAPEQLIRAYFKILIAAALVMSVSLIVNYGVEQVYHVEIFLIIPLAVYCALMLKNPLLRIGGVIFFLSLALFSMKNTGYLIALMAFLYLGYGFWLPRLRRTNPLSRFSGYYVIFVIVLLIAAGVMFLLAFREAYLPSGSAEFRTWAYQRAWNLFLDSPVWGTAFAARAVEKFTLYDISAAGGVLPTHSDIMDMLAHGGLIAIALWLYGLFLVARAGNRTLLTPTTYDHPWTPYAHTFAALSLAGIIAYAVNPVLTFPGNAYMLWTNLGFLLGLSLRPEAIPAPKVAPPRPLGRYEFRRL
ncbi:MAG: O-antigen ligase family protein [Burkholderiales bacterium]